MKQQGVLSPGLPVTLDTLLSDIAAHLCQRRQLEEEPAEADISN